MDKAAFALRLDPVRLTAIRRRADAELRGMNAQIEILLREDLTRRGIRVTEDRENDPT
ncbi:toxin-antitoxin system HicB family antitoxin [Gluconacetobacter sp. 1c LMG 22058]|uniref:Toxin-antitoxin system HicB family antitoxin n=1 Tax=Gluconacetobacter dulcium TaxID=2729096 RepID=A0A7W4K2J0_9PROT|nr:toxin-antitoxin system HicB family antitoxin [Gluconacetobacter dulcium]